MFGMWFRTVVVLATSCSFRCGNWCLGWLGSISERFKHYHVG